MAYVNQAGNFGYGVQLTATQMQNLRDNLAATMAKASGAPVLADNYVTSGMIVADAIGSAHIEERQIGASHIATNIVGPEHMATTCAPIINEDGIISTLRVTALKILDGTSPNTIKASGLNIWNGVAIAEEDNLTKSGGGTNFSVSADGGFIITDVTETVLGILSTSIRKLPRDTSLQLGVWATFSTHYIYVYFNADITSDPHVDAVSPIEISLMYLTE